MTKEGNTQIAPEGAQHGAEKKSRLFLFLVGIAVVLVIVGIFTLLQRREQYNALAKETEKSAIPTVAVIHPTVEPSQEDLALPSTLQAYVESPIYARTTGYVKKWYHDIGSHVQKGDLLAEIDSPEVDQQLSQARADLGTMQANENLSRITATRFEELIKTDGVSKQEVDNAVGDYAARRAAVASAQANVRRLEELESFKRVYAPFSGVITRRNVDLGNLINAGNGGIAQEMFVLAATDPIRAYGTSLEVLQGLRPDDWIVLNPPDSLDEGIQVNVKEPPQKPGPGAPGNGASPSSTNAPSNPNGKPSQGE